MAADAATTSSPRPCSSRPVAPLTSFERILKASMNPDEIRDVHLYAFSRRMIYADGATRIDCPQPILAIGSFLKETEHFSKLLTSGFSGTNPGAPNPIRQYAHESEYDHETDSDLDEYEEPDVVFTPVAGSSSASSSRGKGKGKAKDSGEAAFDDDAPAQPQSTDAPRTHQILIPNIAHRTLKACIFYLYTGKVNFMPLTSEGASQRAFALLTSSESAPPPCSPKSMYRLAESYGIQELQDLTFDEIVSRLKPENIVEEAFSCFFARYDRLREHAVSYLSQHYSDPAVQSVLPEVIQRVVIGDMPHTGGVLQSLLGLRVVVSSLPAPRLAWADSSGTPAEADSGAAVASSTTASAVAMGGSATGLADPHAPSIEESSPECSLVPPILATQSPHSSPGSASPTPLSSPSRWGQPTQSSSPWPRVTRSPWGNDDHAISSSFTTTIA